jgi:hypothetical protein
MEETEQQQERSPWLIELPLIIGGENLGTTLMILEAADGGSYVFALENDDHLNNALFILESPLNLTSLIGILSAIWQSFTADENIQVFNDPVQREKFMESFLPVLQEYYKNKT